MLNMLFLIVCIILIFAAFNGVPLDIAMVMFVLPITMISAIIYALTGV
jgi:hypothetical protein